jgi:hypothetical protein
MQDNRIEDAIARIQSMELCFDTLQNATPAESGTSCYQALLQILVQYYEGGQWLHDFTLDEQGLLPPDLKRGVLSEDGVYNFLSQIPRK